MVELHDPPRRDGRVGDPREKEVEDRLALHSLVEDGEYVRLVSEWVAERILPTFDRELRGGAAGRRPAARSPAMPATPSGSPTTRRR